MANRKACITKSNSTLFLALLVILFNDRKAMAGDFNVIDYGANPDGVTDSSDALQKAWAAACGSTESSSVTVPAGKFLVSHAIFEGTCRNAPTSLNLAGSTILALPGKTPLDDWLLFNGVHGVVINGGVIDGQGASLWQCKRGGDNCPDGATNLRFRDSSEVRISGLTSQNSEGFHIAISESNGVTLEDVNINAPGDSPNTDGIHIQRSSYVTVLHSNISTGDDCISMGPGATNVWIEFVGCGPGHGISIGSLGKQPGEEEVRNITVMGAVITGTENGLRIKTWGAPNSGSVNGVLYQDVTMENVANPIIINQDYCEHEQCGNQDSAVQIKDVRYIGIHGTSATKLAVQFKCSQSNPCRGIFMQDIQLAYQDASEQANSVCENAHGRVAKGIVVPLACLVL